MLAEAGFPEGKGFPIFYYLYRSDSDLDQNIAVELQGMFKQVLGVNMLLQRQEWTVYLQSQSKLDYDLCRSSWVGDYNDPNTFLDMFVTGGGNNRTGWSRKEYDDLIAAAAREVDSPNAYEIFREAERILVTDEAPICPLYYYVGIQFYDARAPRRHRAQPARRASAQGDLLEATLVAAMDRFVFAVYRRVSIVLRALPLKLVWWIGRTLGTGAVTISAAVSAARPAQSRHRLRRREIETEMRALAREHFASLGANFLCGLKIGGLPEGSAAGVGRVRGPGSRRARHRRGQGCVMVISHLGNWELFAQLSPLLFSCPLGTIYQRLGNPLHRCRSPREPRAAGRRAFERRKASRVRSRRCEPAGSSAC